MNAKKLKNDDPDVDPRDIDEAAQETTDPGVEPAPELPPGAEKLTQWDEAPGTRGSATPSELVDDESQIGEELVQDGVEAADRDSRLASTDPDYEP